MCSSICRILRKILRKILKTVTTRYHLLQRKYTKFNFCWLCRRQRWRSGPPDSQLDFRERSSEGKERERIKREKKRGKERRNFVIRERQKKKEGGIQRERKKREEGEELVRKCAVGILSYFRPSNAHARSIFSMLVKTLKVFCKNLKKCLATTFNFKVHSDANST